LECSRAAQGSLSAAASDFDPPLLQEVVAKLGAPLQPRGRDPRPRDMPGALVAVNVTLLSALPKLIQASCCKTSTGSGLVVWRLHSHFEVDRYVPTRVDVAPADGGYRDERAVSECTIETERRGDSTRTNFGFECRRSAP
jgi:hypothetical protein